MALGYRVFPSREYQGRASDHGGLLKFAELSREFIEPLIEGEGIECHFTRGGKLVVYPDTRSLASAQAQVLYQAGLGSKQTVLTRAQCVEHEPALEAYAHRIAGGVWTASDAAADCGEFCMQLAQRIVQRGGDLQMGRSASHFDIDGTSVRALLTDQGPLRADAYVLAAGIGAPEIALTAGIHFLSIRSRAIRSPYDLQWKQYVYELR